MSQLVSELDLTIDRIAVIAPALEHLSPLFESLALELTTQLALKQKVGLEMATTSEGSLRHWMSFTMGLRGRLESRVVLVGASLDEALRNPLLFEIIDAVYFYLPLTHADSDKVFRLKVTPRFAKLPCFATLEGDANSDLRGLAVQEWFRRSFRRPQFLDSPSQFLREGMEWVLSV